MNKTTLPAQGGDGRCFIFDAVLAEYYVVNLDLEYSTSSRKIHYCIMLSVVYSRKKPEIP